MGDRTVTDHPSANDLRAFGLGQLAGAAASAVEDHVSHCAECCRTLQGVGSDTLVNLVRTVGQPPKPATMRTLGPGGAAADPNATAADASVGSDEVADCPPALRDHPRYRVLALLGKGGMGAVFKAEHKLMGRPVAIKVINQALTSKPAIVERFRREVQAAARLAHPNIVAAHDAEQAGDTHFLVMEFVEGTDLARLTAARGRLSVAEACDTIRQAARGLQHAHERGMVHRDIKPHNLMRTPDGIIKVLDFGLARWASEASSAAGGETGQGVLLGTVDYMAPEQADSAHDADIRSDIYSLGCTLYYLLAGRPPFPDGTLIQKVASHAGRAPTPLTEIRPDLPPGLLEVLHVMIAKSPALRYQTPDQVASALEPFTSTRFGGSAILRHAAKPESAGALRKPARDRRPDQPSTAPRRGWRRLAIGAVVLLGLLALAAYLAGPAVLRYVTDEGELVIEIDDPQVQAVVDQTGVTLHDKATDRIYKVKPGRRDLKAGDYEVEVTEVGGDMRLFTKEFTITRGGTTPVKVTLDLSALAKKPAPTPEEKAGEVQKVGEVRSLDGHKAFGTWGIRGVAFTPNGNQALSSDAGGHVILWDLASGKQVCQLEGHQGEVCNVSIAADGRHAATAGVDNTARVWNLESGKQLQIFQGNFGTIEGVSISPDSRRVLTSSGDGIIRLWDVETGKLLHSLTGHTGPIRSVVFSHDGRRAVSGGRDKTVRLWDVETGKEITRFTGHNGWVTGVDVSADGGRIVSCSKLDKTARVWDVATGKEICRLEGNPGEEAGVFTPDGRYVLSGGADKVLRLWDAATGREVQRLEGDAGPIYCVAVSADGCYALSGGADLILRLWRLPTSPPPVKPELLYSIPWMDEQQHMGANIYQTGISSDSRLFFGAGDSGPTGTIRVWEVATGKQVQELVPGGDPWFTFAQFVPGGKYLVASYSGYPGNDQRDMYLWDVATGKVVRKFVGHTANGPQFAVSPDGKRLLSWADDKTVRLWDVDTGMELRQLEGHTDKAAGVFSPDGRQVLTFSPDKTLRLWDVESGKELQRLGGHTDACTGCFSPDGQQALSYGPDGTIRLWDLGTGKEVRRFEGLAGKVNFAGFVAGGRLVVGKSDNLKCRIWETASGRPVNEIDGAKYGRDGWSVTATPDGRQALVSVENDGSVRVLDLATGKETFRYDGCPKARAFSFAPDGTIVVAGSFRAGMFGFRLPTPPPPAKPELLYSIPFWDAQQHMPAHIGTTGISSDGRLFFGAGDSGPTGTIRVWEVATGKQVQELVPGGDAWFSFAQFVPGGKYLVASYTGTAGGPKFDDLYLWDVAAGQVVRKFVGHTAGGPQFAVSPDGRRLLSWANDKTVRLWDVDTGMELRQLEGHTDKAAGVFSPDGRQVLTFSPDKTLRLWDVESGKELQRLEGHTDACTGCFSPDGKQALSYGADHTIRLWDLETGNEVRRYEGSKAQWYSPDSWPEAALWWAGATNTASSTPTIRNCGSGTRPAVS